MQNLPKQTRPGREFCRRNVGPCLFAAALLLLAAPVWGQTLRFSNQRSAGIPEYATLRIGPFYSDVTFSQSLGYRYTTATGAGTDFLFENERGKIREDGMEFPVISSLVFRNYLLISDRIDAEMDVRIGYEHYPLKTQEDQFRVDISEEGVLGNFSTAMRLTPFVNVQIRDHAVWRTDYVDTRGLEDSYGGSRFEYFQNVLGADLDWLLGKNRNLGLTVSRTDLIPTGSGSEFDDQERVTYAETLLYEQLLSPRVTGGLSAGFSQTSYSSTNRSDSASASYSARLSARVTDQTQAAAVAGYSSGTSKGSGGRAESTSDTMSGSVSLNTQLNPRLQHALTYSRSLSGGFESEFEIRDAVGYQLSWSDALMRGGLHANWSAVDPSREEVHGFSDWSTGATFSYPVTRFALLRMSTTYTMRINDEPATLATDAEQTADYSTWVSRLETGFSLTEKIDLTAYAEHVERDSKNEDLAYTRDTFAMTLTYSHHF